MRGWLPHACPQDRSHQQMFQRLEIALVVSKMVQANHDSKRNKPESLLEKLNKSKMVFLFFSLFKTNQQEHLERSTIYPGHPHPFARKIKACNYN